MKYSARITEDRRLVILRLLAETPGYNCNTSILQSALEDFGHSVSRDVVHTDVAWLAEQGLVSIEAIATVDRVTLTNRGVDVAAGRAVVPGVRRPNPA